MSSLRTRIRTGLTAIPLHLKTRIMSGSSLQRVIISMTTSRKALNTLTSTAMNTTLS